MKMQPRNALIRHFGSSSVRLLAGIALSACTSDLPTDPAHLPCDFERDPPCVRGHVCRGGLCVNPSQYSDGGPEQAGAEDARTKPRSPADSTTPRDNERQDRPPAANPNRAPDNGAPAAPADSNAGVPSTISTEAATDDGTTAGETASPTRSHPPHSTGESLPSDGATNTSNAGDNIHGELTSSPAGPPRDAAASIEDSEASDLDAGASTEADPAESSDSSDDEAAFTGDGPGDSDDGSSEENSTDSHQSDIDGGRDDTTAENDAQSCSDDCTAPARGSAACVRGVCQITCDDELELCDGHCVDLRIDRDHCGACHHSCTLACISGICLL